MFRVSTLFKNTRLDKELEYAEISKKLKIPVKYLEAIENEKISHFPQEPYCSLIVKDYANFLGLNGEEILSLFRRDFAQKKKSVSPKGQLFNFTPQFTFKIGTIAIIFIFSVYLISEYFKFNRPPSLKVNCNNQEIWGSTDSESTVRINQDLIIVDSSGSFKKKNNLGSNSKVIVESKSINGKTTTVEKICK